MKKRLLAALLCALMLATLFPIVLPASAAAEGDWTTYTFANEYSDEDFYESRLSPEAGYKYTAEGFTVIPPDYTDTLTKMTVSSKEQKPLKEGLYLQFRVDDFSYGGDIGADYWICLTLNTGKVEADGTKTGKVEPGSTNFGGGWLTLIRGGGDGERQSLPHLTDPKTEDFGGTFTYDGSISTITVPRDNQGREIYTLEVTWDGSAYEMKLNGTPIPGSAETTALLERLSPDGEFFVGISMWSGVRDGTAALTVLKYGTCEADATTPVGDDSKEPEDNCDFGYADILEPSTVPVNQPAILWNPDTVNIKSGHNCHFTVQGDNTWRVEATEADLFFNFTPKRQWSYNAEDFPVFGILLRNFWMDTGTLWYSAGEYMTSTDDCTIPFSVYDGEFYGENEEYVFIPVDLTDFWAGRINAIRIDVHIADESVRGFEICFAGMFRNKDEAYAYAHDWLAYDNPVPDTSAYPGQDCDGAPTDPPTEPPYEPPYEPPVSTQPPEIWDTMPPETETPVADIVDPEQAVEDILAKYGCTGSLGAVTLLAVAAATVALTKKKE